MTAPAVPVERGTPVHARPAGSIRDCRSIAGRAIRAIPREFEYIVPALVVPLFFYVVNIGTLSDFAERSGVGDYKAFLLPAGIVFAVTGISRASALVTDIQDGYFDRLLMTPIRRQALLLGLMMADFVLVVALCIPVLVLGFALGVWFETGVLGLLAFLLLAGAWGLAFTGFPYAIALRTGSPAAVNSSFILFFPFAFLTTAFAPQEALSGWLSAIASVNPMTYLLEALRALLMVGWEWGDLLQGVAAIAIVGVLSQTLAFLALRGRVRRS